jgi:hypothetical protein
MTPEQLAIATAIRSACIQAALAAYETAREDGLCHAGAWECAVDAIRSLDVAAVAEMQATGRNQAQPPSR